MSTRKRIGTCSVDAGLITLIDPCYVDHAFAWSNFCKKLFADEGFNKNGYMSWNGGVVVGKFGGDGGYPVYAEIGRNGLIESVTIDFTQEGMDDE